MHLISLFSGTLYLSFSWSAMSRIEFYFKRCCVLLLSTSFLFGWVVSSLLYLSTPSITAASDLSCSGSTFVCISHAAVGDDLIAPEINLRL